MFQRIQSIFLFGVIAFTSLLLYTSVLHFMASKHIYEFNLFGLYDMSQTGKTLMLSSIALPVISIFIIILSLVAAFSYKNRKRQIAYCKAILGLILLLAGLGFYYYTIFRKLVVLLISPQEVLSYTVNVGNAPIIIFILLFLVIMSWRSIQKDDDLVRSADRLR